MCASDRPILFSSATAPADPPQAADPAQAVARQFARRPLPGAAPVAEGSAAPKSSRRRRLWELPRVVLCPVLGTCLSIDQLRRLADKVLGQRVLADDYELHCSAIHECAQRSDLAERVQRELDTRHAQAIRQARALAGPDALHLHWQAATQGSDVGAALWVTLTHPGCDAALEERVQRDIHMLQHQAGTGVRLDVQRLQEVVAENAVLGRELAAVQARVTRQMAEKAAQIERQQAELVRLRAQLVARDTLIGCLRDDLAQQAAQAEALPARLDLRYRLEWQQQRLDALARALEHSEQQVRRLQSRAAEPLPVVDAVPLPVAAPPDGAAEALDLQDKAVLCVGGRTASVPIYRREIEIRGARFLHHDGGEEDGAARLDAHLEAADLVICQTGCISHGAYWRVKDHCKRTGKRCVFVDRPSASGLLRGLETASAVAGPGG